MLKGFSLYIKCFINNCMFSSCLCPEKNKRCIFEISLHGINQVHYPHLSVSFAKEGFRRQHKILAFMYCMYFCLDNRSLDRQAVSDTITWRLIIRPIYLQMCFPFPLDWTSVSTRPHGSWGSYFEVKKWTLPEGGWGKENNTSETWDMCFISVVVSVNLVDKCFIWYICSHVDLLLLITCRVDCSLLGRHDVTSKQNTWDRSGVNMSGISPYVSAVCRFSTFLNKLHAWE